MQKLAQERNATVLAVQSVKEKGILDVDVFEKMLRDPSIGPKVALVCMTHVPTNSGVVSPLEEVGAIIQIFNNNHRVHVSAKGSKDDAEEIENNLFDRPILYIVDACQSVGQMVVNVQHLKCDGLSACGRKYLRGPRGTGFLYMREEIAERVSPSHIDHAGAPIAQVPDCPIIADVQFKYRAGARRFEFWESSIANRLGLGKAVEYAMDIGLEKIESRCTELALELQRQLRKIDGVTLHYDTSSFVEENSQNAVTAKQCGIVTFSVNSLESSYVKAKLLEKRFTVSVVPATSTPLDSSRTKCKDLVRASLSYFNTMEEIAAFTNSLRQIICVGVTTAGTS